MPVLGGGDLRGLGFVAAYEPSKLPARLLRSSYRQQEMPHHRHPVTAENEALNVVREVERGRVLSLSVSRVAFDEAFGEEALASFPGGAAGALINLANARSSDY